MTEHLDLPRRYRDQIEALLREHVPSVEVWAYGSRVSGRSHEGSDLELVLRGPDLKRIPSGQLSDLSEALEESNVPILVQTHDWARLPESFHREIEQEYVVLVADQDKPVYRSIGDYFTLKRGTTYKSRLLSQPGPVLLGLATIQRNGGFRSDSLQTYGGDSPPKLLVEPGEIYVSLKDVTQSADLLGAVARLPIDQAPGRLTQDTVKLERIRKNISIDYIYWLLRTPQYRDYCRAHATGTTNLGLSRDDFLAFPVPNETDGRRGIVDSLMDLDDKIELNRRMDKTLEEMARALFKSWFVDFDPVRAKMEGRDTGLPPDIADLFPDRLVDSELGEIPEGWEVKTLDSFGEVVTGKTPSTKIPAYFGDEIPFLRIPDMHGKIYALQTQMMLSSHGASSQPQKTLPPGSVSVSCIATPGLVVLNHHATQTNQQINSIIPRDQALSKYIYWSCRQLSSDIKTGGTGGSVFVNMNKSAFSSLPALDAEPSIIHAFDQLVSPIHDSILANEKQSQILAQVRDALLPRLISGEMRVNTRDEEGEAIGKHQ